MPSNSPIESVASSIETYSSAGGVSSGRGEWEVLVGLTISGTDECEPSLRVALAGGRGGAGEFTDPTLLLCFGGGSLIGFLAGEVGVATSLPPLYDKFRPMGGASVATV